MKPTKYRSKKCVLDGRKFDSEAEMKRAMILKIWLSEGIISELEYQPSYCILPGYIDNCGRKNRPIVYKADFSYIEDGKSITEDVKGMQTPEYRLKAKLFRAKFPDLVHREIKNGKDMLTHKPKKTKRK